MCCGGWLISPPLLMLLGVLMIITGRIWFAAQILGEMGIENALWVFVVPFMPTVYFFKRIDVAWKPFFFGLAGFAALLIGAGSAPP